MLKISQRQIQKISKRDLNSDSLIRSMKKEIKKDKMVLEKFKEYGIDIDEVDSVCVEFVPLDVSAKTKDKKIYLNKTMLSKENPFEFAVPYLAHEIVHYLQQSTGSNFTKNKAEDYLDKPTEMEAFETQVDFKKRHEGEDVAERYVEDLLDYHNINGKKRKEKERELLDE